MPIRRATTAALVALTMLSVNRPASAEEPAPAPSSSSERTVMNAAIVGGYGLGAIGLGLSLLFHAQANSLEDDRRDIARANGSEGDTVWRCVGPDECGRMKSLREDAETARSRWAASLGVALGGITVGTAVLIARLIDSSDVVDSGGGGEKV